MLISIVTVCKNAEDTIEQTIQSVIGQQGVDLEYIVVDGASTDGTGEIIEKYRDHISVFVSEPDQGISDAFNKGILRASGDLIGIINADDILLHGALRHVAEHIESSTDVYFGQVESFDVIESIPEVHCHSVFKPTLLRKLKTEMPIGHPATFVRKRAYEKYGLFDLRYHNSMDRDLLLRMYLGGAVFQESPYVYTLFRTGGITTKSFNRSIEESYEISREMGTGAIPAVLTKLKKKAYLYLKMN